MNRVISNFVILIALAALVTGCGLVGPELNYPPGDEEYFAVGSTIYQHLRFGEPDPCIAAPCPDDNSQPKLVRATALDDRVVIDETHEDGFSMTALEAGEAKVRIKVKGRTAKKWKYQLREIDSLRISGFSPRAPQIVVGETVDVFFQAEGEGGENLVACGTDLGVTVKPAGALAFVENNCTSMKFEVESLDEPIEFFASDGTLLTTLETPQES